MGCRASQPQELQFQQGAGHHRCLQLGSKKQRLSAQTQPTEDTCLQSHSAAPALPTRGALEQKAKELDQRQ